MSESAVQDAAAETVKSAKEGPGLLGDLELNIDVCLGEQQQTLQELVGLSIGDSVPAGEVGDDAAMLRVLGRPYALGELVVVDGRFAFKVSRLIGPSEGGL